jgi:sarcosine/dimethylglycine N-methyltransferase
MPDPRSAAEVAAEAYYDSKDAGRFYEAICGGEDIHIGLYGRNAGTIDIPTACYKLTAAMANRLPALVAGAQVLDLGAGYGGAARYLARRFDCKVHCLNISEVQNERNRRRNRGLGLQDRIDVVHGSFHRVPLRDASVDLVWSQGAFFHSDDREQLVAEVQRVLKPGGQVLFTDQMQSDACPPGVLSSFYERFKVAALSSPLSYRRTFAQRGLRQEEWCDLSPDLLYHYTTVRSVLRQHYDKLSREISTSYLDRMLINLNNWVSASHAGHLRWGIFHFRKPQLPEAIR